MNKLGSHDCQSQILALKKWQKVNSVIIAELTTTPTKHTSTHQTDKLAFHMRQALATTTP